MRVAGDIVPGCGPRSARIVLIGESPWKSEDASGTPFAGASGGMLNRLLAEAGIDRSDIYVDNVYPFKPPEPAPVGNRLKSVPTEKLIYYMNDLHKRLGELADPYVIVPTGNYALYALLRKGKVEARIYNAQGYPLTTSEAEKKAGITQMRGSIYLYRDVHGRMIKVVPTIHPAGILQSMSWEWRSIEDWKRVAKLARTREWEPPQRSILISPTVADWQEVYCWLAAHPETPLFYDVETWGNQLRCVGVAWRVDEAIVFPTPDKAERAYWMPYLKALLELPNPKGGQYFLFDSYWMRRLGVNVRNLVFDVGCMHHCLDPNEEHNLGFLASIYTEQPFWKDAAKDAEDVAKFWGNQDELYRYNGLDNCVPVEICQALLGKLAQAGMLEFYFKHYVGMYEPLLDTMLNGIRVDVLKQKEVAKRLLEECGRIRGRLKEIAGEELYATERESKLRAPTNEEWHKILQPIFFGSDQWGTNEVPKAKFVDREAAKALGYIMSKGQIREYSEKAKKDFSRLKLLRLFHERLGVKAQLGRGKKKGKTVLDDAALRKIALRYAGKEPSEAAKLVLDHRARKKEHDIVKGAWDSDGRIRCQYTLTTKQARLASKGNPMRKGYNLQNVKRGEMRKTFLADEGCVMVRLDYSQIEDRICKMYTQHPDMIALANTKPWEYDAHMETAKLIFDTPTPTKQQRQLSKSVNHAAQRGMAGLTMSERLLKEGHVLAPTACQNMIDKYHVKLWQISKLYFPWVRDNLVRDGVLTNSWGYRACFLRSPGIRITEDLLKEAYSFYMQSDCAGWLNQLGFIPAHRWLKQEVGKAPGAQVHDEVLACLPPGRSYDYACFMVGSMQQERMILGRPLVVPVEIKVGLDWASGTEWKKLPERDEWMSVIERLMKEGK